MEIQGTVLQLLVTAAPGVILYFTGWSYLYFYLDSFQINISEVNLDLPTVFVYAYPPLHALWESYSIAITALIALVAILWIAGEAAWRWTGRLSPRAQTLLGVGVARYLAARMRTVSPTAWTISLLFVLVFVLPFPLARVTAWAAAHAADQVWAGQTVELNPVSKGHEAAAAAATHPSDAHAPAPASKDPSAADDEQAGLIANYAACMQRGELGLIFSVEAHYYLLCRAADDQDTGSVFEVTGKEGLISVRESVYRRKWGSK